MEGRASFAWVGGFIRMVDEAFDAPEDGARSAASFGETAAGELLVPVYRRVDERKIASTTLSSLSTIRSFMPHRLPHAFA
jgi:hypothetical protein